MHLEAGPHQVVLQAVLNGLFGILFCAAARIGHPALGQWVGREVLRHMVTLQAVLPHHDFEHLGHAPRFEA